MQKEIAIRAAQLLERINDADMAIDELHQRDVFCELPSEVQKGLITYIEKYQETLKNELEDL